MNGGPIRAAASIAVVLILAAVLPSGAAHGATSELLSNGSFESTGTAWLAPWYFGVKPGGAGSISQSTTVVTDGSRSAAVSVTGASSSAPWLVQLSQSKLALAAGQTYAISVGIRAGAPRTVQVILQQTASPYTTYVAWTASVSTSWQRLVYSYTPTTSLSDVSLRFNLAATSGTIWLDAASVTSGSSTTPTPAPAPTVTPSPSPTAGTTRSDAFVPIADAHVRSDLPSSNFGGSTTLTSDGSPVTMAFMKFDLSRLAGRTISKATLGMRVTNPTTATQNVRLAGSSSWTEYGITYQNRPSVGSVRTSFPGGPSGAWVTVDVTAAMGSQAGTITTLAIDSGGADGYAFDSREATTDRVTLTVVSAGSTASPSPSSSASPTPTPSTTPATTGKGVALRNRSEAWSSAAGALDSDFADLVGAGAGWARIHVNYSSSPDPRVDAEIAAAKSHGIRLVVTLGKPWPDKDLGSDADRAYYRSWVRGMVGRYGYWVRDWEILNEPNLHYEWNIDESPTSDQTAYKASVARYLTVLQDAYTTIKSVDPGAIVHFAGLSEWTVERYLDVVVASDAYRYFDVMDVHPYGWDPARVVSRFDSVEAKMDLRPEYAAKPIWVTEVGFNTSWSNKAGFVTSEQTKADDLARVFPALRSAGASGPVFWYTLHENDLSPGYGLEVKDAATLRTQYLPAYDAFRRVSP